MVQSQRESSPPSKEGRGTGLSEGSANTSAAAVTHTARKSAQIHAKNTQEMPNADIVPTLGHVQQVHSHGGYSPELEHPNGSLSHSTATNCVWVLK